MYSPRIGASQINATQQISNDTLSARKFFGGQNPSFRPVEVNGPEPSCTGSIYAPSEASVFKFPNTIKKHSEWARVESSVNIFTNGFRYSDIDKVNIVKYARYVCFILVSYFIFINYVICHCAIYPTIVISITRAKESI